jgi:S1-C subfamily serine protease
VFFSLILGIFLSLSSVYAQEAPVTQTELTTENIIAIAKATVNYEAFILTDGRGGSGFCTAVVLDNTEKGATILTARHCLPSVGDMYVDFKLVTNIIVSLNYDLAVLKTSEKLEYRKTSILAKTPIALGEFIFGSGYPAITPYVYVGYMLGDTKTDSMAYMEVVPGCSGGGLFNKNLELIGIVWGTYPGKTLSIFTSLVNIKAFLKENKIKYYEATN